MNENVCFTPGELQLIEGLLERERNELPPEIHHTRTNSVRVELKERLDTVRRLLLKLRSPVHTSA